MKDRDILGKFEVKNFQKNRQNFIDSLESGFSKHFIFYLIDYDVTKGRELIKKIMKETGKRLSFTAWIIKCMAQAVCNNKIVNAFRHKNKKLVIFDDVDVCILVERELENEKIPLPYIIRKANEKTILEITDELHNAKTQKLEGSMIIGDKKNARLVKLAKWTPRFIRLFCWQRFLKNAYLAKRMMGTVFTTAISVNGKNTGYGIPSGGLHTLGLVIGGIQKKPGVINNNIEIREFLHVTVYVDHDVVDGAPFSKYVANLNELVENAFGLSE